MDDSKISMAVIKRLPRYYRYLGDLMDKGISRISSKELSERMGITASQIRQDLNHFGSFGQQGYGYNVGVLFGEIERVLGLSRVYSLIVIGAGNFGQALVNYQNFANRGFVFTAMFDVDPEIIGTTVNGVEVLDVADLEGYLKNNHVDIAALTLPGKAASGLIQILAVSSITGIWNFSKSDLNVPRHIVVENVRLSDSLMTLTYRMNEDDIMQRLGGS